MIIAPVIAASFMGVCTYFIQHALVGILGNAISTVAAIILGAIIYAITLFMLRILSKEDILMIPFGTKLYALLLKLGIYKEEVAVTEKIQSVEYETESKSFEPIEAVEEKTKRGKRKPKHMK